MNLKIKVSWHRFQRWRQYLALSFQRIRESEGKKDEARQGSLDLTTCCSGVSWLLSLFSLWLV